MTYFPKTGDLVVYTHPPVVGDPSISYNAEVGQVMTDDDGWGRCVLLLSVLGRTGTQEYVVSQPNWDRIVLRDTNPYDLEPIS